MIPKEIPLKILIDMVNILALGLTSICRMFNIGSAFDVSSVFRLRLNVSRLLNFNFKFVCFFQLMSL